MVKSLIVENIRKIKKSIPRIEEKIKVKISINKGSLLIKGNEYNEFITETIVVAVDFGFDLEDAFLLLDENFVLEFIDIKTNTHRRNIKDVRSRVIGKKGKAMKTIENLTDSVVVLKDNVVGVIVNSENLDVTVQAIESLIRGAKHGNVFSYLEKNKSREKLLNDDLGLKEKAKKLK